VILASSEAADRHERISKHCTLASYNLRLCLAGPCFDVSIFFCAEAAATVLVSARRSLLLGLCQKANLRVEDCLHTIGTLQLRQRDQK
jgi:hypothetical protein